MHFMKTITVVIPSVFSTAMTDAFMLVTPLLQTAVDVVFIRVDTRAGCNRRLDQRLDRDLLDIVQHPDHHVSTPLNHPEDRRLLRGDVTRPRLPLRRRRRPRRPFLLPYLACPCDPPRYRTSSHSTSSLGSVLEVEMTAQAEPLAYVKTRACGLHSVTYLHI